MKARSIIRAASSRASPSTTGAPSPLGTLLEDLAIVFITITFGASPGNLTAASIGAAAAVIIMAGIAFFVRSKIADVPNRMLKLVV